MWTLDVMTIGAMGFAPGSMPIATDEDRMLTKACEPCVATHQLVSPAVRFGQLARHTGAPLLQSGVAAAEPPFARAPPLSSPAIYLPASGLIARLHSPPGTGWSRASSARPYAS